MNSQPGVYKQWHIADIHNKITHNTAHLGDLGFDFDLDLDLEREGERTLAGNFLFLSISSLANSSRGSITFLTGSTTFLNTVTLKS